MDWVDYQFAVKLICLEQVAYSLGPRVFRVHGGMNAAGQRSCIEVDAIIATHGHNPTAPRNGHNYTPPLNNKALFKRDRFLCLYCGQRFAAQALSRDHVRPSSLGGRDCWNNVVTACKRCNNFKAGRTPEQAGLQLLAIPFTPTHAEYIYLQGKRILADQMEFLLAHFPRHSPLRERLEREHKLRR